MNDHLVTDRELLAALDLIAAVQTMAHDEDAAAGLAKDAVRREQQCFLRVRARRGGGRNVTFPARQYSVNGERRSFALLRPAALDPAATDSLRNAIEQAFRDHEAQAEARASL